MKLEKKKSVPSGTVIREYKSVRFELESTNEDGEFSGYAAVFGNIDSGGDIIEKGAFAKTIAEDFDRIKIFSDHDTYDLPIGKPLELREDEKGLFIRGKISDTVKGRDIRTLLKDRVLTEMSIGYKATIFDYDSGSNVRRIKEIKLWDVSIVTWAMNDQAKISDVKKLVDQTKADNKSGRMTRSQTDALRLFVAVVRQLTDLLSSFLDPKTESESQGVSDESKNINPQKQTKSAETIFEIVPAQKN